MVIDTSALLAILQNEPERSAYNRAIELADTSTLSTASFVELSMVIESRYGPEGTRDLDLFLSRANIELIPVSSDQAYVTRQAFRQYGKRRQPAGLNFGNCFSYALAKSLGEPLLLKGNDFSQTDLTHAVT